MSEQPRSGRLDAETLAAYVDGQLPPEERARVDAEIAVDPESYEWVVNAIRVAEELDAPREGSAGSGSGGAAPSGGASAHATAVRNSAPAFEPTPAPAADPPGAMMPQPVPAHALGSASVTPLHKRRSVQAGVVALLATAAALVLVVRLQPAWWQQIAGRDDVDPRFAKLVAAVGEERYIEGRLTGGFKYGPLRSVTRGPADLSNRSLALLAAAGELQKAAHEDPTPENLHAWGIAQLLLDNQDSLDGSIRTLATAVSLSGDAGIRSDLAAAYVQRFRATGEPRDIRDALQESERALAADPGLQPAAFNRALALELGGAAADAISAWQDYASQDQSGGWSAEASQRLKVLRQ
jgi:tetratricopeptide (TPR) repeat protein